MKLASAQLFAVLLLSGLLTVPAAWAQTIYSWTDEDGITHFTDRKPDTDREVTVQKAIAEPESPLEIRRSGPDDDPVWWFRNRLAGPLAVRLSLAESDNVVSEPELPRVFILPGETESELVTLGPLDPRRSWRYRFQTEAVVGSPEAVHRPPGPYRPPFAPGESFTIGQAFGGAFSHSDAQSFHAVDIAMPVGTAIHAARAGVVMDIARYFHRAGTDRDRDGPRANFVRILHDDGTMAVYAHLDYEGVRVHPGERVARGQYIGRSGNTGYSSGPHLHFVIQKNRDMALVSVPFEFEGAGGGAVTPRERLRLSAPDARTPGSSL
ncbi:peptidoglycan DD-metalloendopeptidase family protein [Wenzhouxiangella limi]|uniref:M23 family metallopeptidase n=1 Tax=Wenzhouxiangella limi TaxID=2707351 RepID=A0A845V3U1_9GAMM|nr:M23 family metallopeptidase [Wenzhouxiangella limi]NDY94901.1 M23 family metallopeptidase [Wenzhouxiangella limi]